LGRQPTPSAPARLPARFLTAVPMPATSRQHRVLRWKRGHAGLELHLRRPRAADTEMGTLLNSWPAGWCRETGYAVGVGDIQSSARRGGGIRHPWVGGDVGDEPGPGSGRSRGWSGGGRAAAAFRRPFMGVAGCFFVSRDPLRGMASSGGSSCREAFWPRNGRGREAAASGSGQNGCPRPGGRKGWAAGSRPSGLARVRRRGAGGPVRLAVRVDGRGVSG
jgi:hypothetical protein